MILRRCALLLFLFSLSPSLSADDPAAESKSPGKTAKPGIPAKPENKPPVFHLRDGGKVTGRPKVAKFKVETKYGTLEVPASDIIQVRFARRVDREVKKKLEALIEKLGSEDFDERESAMDEIREIGKDAVAQLRKFEDSENEEVKNRAEILIDELGTEEKKEGEVVIESEVSELEGDLDEIVTKRFTIRGRVLEDSFAIQSRYGTLDLATADIVGIFFLNGGRIVKSFTVAGTRTTPSSWMRTKLNLIKGRRLRIKASGLLTVPNYGFSAGPGGSTRSTTNGVRALTLVGKIGAKGKQFVIGVAFKGKAATSGELYLAITPYRRYAATGSFKVKVEAGD